jgi:hypothetical protein
MLSWVPWWGWTAAGALTYGLLWRITFRALWETRRSDGWGEFWFSFGMASFLFWFVWPAWGVEVLAERHQPDQIARRIAGESRGDKRRRRERELRARQEHIEKLEQELGIK